MYPRISWELVAGTLGTLEHALGTTALKLVVADLVKKLLSFYGTRHFIALLAEFAPGLCPEPHEVSPHPNVSFI